MRWFWATKSSSDRDEADSDKSTAKEYLEYIKLIPIPYAEVIIPSLVLTSTLLALNSLYKRRLRRIPTVAQLPPSALSSHQTLFGTAVSVGDADNFRLFHTPGGRLLGWGWLRTIPSSRKGLAKAGTLHIRLAGVDAPEGAHFGMTAQPYAVEAQDWLKRYVLGRRVRVRLLARDRYERVVCSVKVWRWGIRRDVSLEMAKAGYAEMYDNAGAEYGGLESQLRKAVENAKRHRKGMWAQNPKNYQSPADYKKEHQGGGSV